MCKQQNVDDIELTSAPRIEEKSVDGFRSAFYDGVAAGIKGFCSVSRTDNYSVRYGLPLAY